MPKNGALGLRVLWHHAPGATTALRLPVIFALLPQPVADSGNCTVFLLVSKIVHTPAWNTLTVSPNNHATGSSPFPEV
jgi:hypothetical protein